MFEKIKTGWFVYNYNIFWLTLKQLCFYHYNFLGLQWVYDS